MFHSTVSWDEVQGRENESVTQKERGRECVCAKVSERPREKRHLPDWNTRRQAYEHRPEEGQWLHCEAGQRVTVGLDAGGPRKVTPGAVVSE